MATKKAAKKTAAPEGKASVETATKAQYLPNASMKAELIALADNLDRAIISSPTPTSDMEATAKALRKLAGR